MNLHIVVQKTTLVFVIFTLIIACQGKSNQKEKTDQTSVASHIQLFYQPPSIPSMLISPEERANYLVSHYWENFNFTDTTLIAKPEVIEQALADFIDLLPHVSIEKSTQSITLLMDSASSDSSIFAHFISLIDKYLYDPNSPMRNEEFYIPVLRFLVASPKLDQAHKIRPRSQLEMALKNRLGSIASDFVYTLADGKTARMREIKSDYTILFFNNPDCTDCKRVKSLLTNNITPNRYPRIKLLALYLDEDMELWKKTDYPSHWINAYDREQIVTLKRVYDMKAIPCLYLLDHEKRVIFKDVPVEHLLDYLHQL